METYSLPVWAIRRLGGEAKKKLEAFSDQIELKDALKDPRLLLVKVVIGKVIDALPASPRPSQIEGIPPDLGRAFDVLDRTFFDQDPLLKFKNQFKKYLKLLVFGEEPPGVVFLAPSFFGPDP